ncbi:MAG: hypothetical protein JWQ87_2223 [Candidatus Sulfotelmatobacter sp.]|nr:hypothetical protein [Candidatus Sulfotelmatobacter sp.]
MGVEDCGMNRLGPSLATFVRISRHSLGEVSRRRAPFRKGRTPILSAACRQGKHVMCCVLDCLCRECGHPRIP